MEGRKEGNLATSQTFLVLSLSCKQVSQCTTEQGFVPHRTIIEKLSPEVISKGFHLPQVLVRHQKLHVSGLHSGGTKIVEHHSDYRSSWSPGVLVWLMIVVAQSIFIGFLHFPLLLFSYSQNSSLLRVQCSHTGSVDCSLFA